MADCHNCKGNMTVSLLTYESEMLHRERTERRLWIVILLLIAALVASNVGWLWYESQFETVITTQTVMQDAEDGKNVFVGGDFYGEANRNDNDQDQDPEGRRE